MLEMPYVKKSIKSIYLLKPLLLHLSNKFLIKQNYPPLIHKVEFWHQNHCLKVALRQKILKNCFVAKINIPNHYPEQKI